MKVAIQGEEGSFHDLAAHKLLGSSIEIVSCGNFRETISSLLSGEVEYAVIAIENSLFGTINEVYDLLIKNNVSICGETYLKIKQCLIGLPGTNINEIKEVYSHPVALAQCEDFLESTLPGAKKFEEADTAGSVELIKSIGDKSKAAIAGTQAAELHGMEILAEEIETNKQNYTRFVILDKGHNNINEQANKTSLVLKTPGDVKPGSLFRALGVFAKNEVNLFALHSRPIIGKAWHYMFYLDIDSSPNIPHFDSIISELKNQGCDVKILGSYKNGML